uniref:Secreted protein n=1 Tax=Timema douglasi TaxID=61478 RepID=A0A7R8VV61_TIMDO|nr:unnamed protein product [Timema douglasi]
MWPYCCVILIVLFVGPGFAADCTGYGTVCVGPSWERLKNIVSTFWQIIQLTMSTTTLNHARTTLLKSLLSTPITIFTRIMSP